MEFCSKRYFYTPHLTINHLSAFMMPYLKLLSSTLLSFSPQALWHKSENSNLAFFCFFFTDNSHLNSNHYQFLLRSSRKPKGWIFLQGTVDLQMATRFCTLPASGLIFNRSPHYTPLVPHLGREGWLIWHTAPEISPECNEWMLRVLYFFITCILVCQWKAKCGSPYVPFKMSSGKRSDVYDAPGAQTAGFMETEYTGKVLVIWLCCFQIKQYSTVHVWGLLGTHVPLNYANTKCLLCTKTKSYNSKGRHRLFLPNFWRTLF